MGSVSWSDQLMEWNRVKYGAQSVARHVCQPNHLRNITDLLLYQEFNAILRLKQGSGGLHPFRFLNDETL